MSSLQGLFLDPASFKELKKKCIAFFIHIFSKGFELGLFNARSGYDTSGLELLHCE
jgi:hypothetical protein